MFSKSFKILPCRIIAVVLSAALVLTFTPFLEGPASAAASDEGKDGSSTVTEITNNLYSSSDEEVPESTVNSLPKQKMKGAYGDGKSLCDKKSITMKGNTLTVDLSISSKYRSGATRYAFAGLMIDGEVSLFDTPTYGLTDSTDISSMGTGYHSFVFIVVVSNNGGSWEYGGDDNQILYDAKVNTITSKPSYKGKYTVYSKTMYIYPYSNLFSNADGDLYLEYKAKGSKTWKRSSAMNCSAIQLAMQQNWRIKGLKPNKKYYTILRHGQWVTYETDKGGDGKAYFFGGPVLKSTTLKTGKKNKPAVKSAKVKVYGVKYHKIRHPGHYEWFGNVLMWRSAWTEKFYTYKIRVTVKLKKKTGAKGLWISTKFGSKYVKGNKKTYVAKFTPYPNYRVKRPPKGFGKATVKVRSYEKKSWGGYSPIAKKKVKVK